MLITNKNHWKCSYSVIICQMQAIDRSRSAQDFLFFLQIIDKNWWGCIYIDANWRLWACMIHLPVLSHELISLFENASRERLSTNNSWIQFPDRPCETKILSPEASAVLLWRYKTIFWWPASSNCWMRLSQELDLRRHRASTIPYIWEPVPGLKPLRCLE